MKKQIIFIWWWIAKENFINFKDYLEKFEFNPYEEKKEKWRDSLQKDLWEDFEVIMIPMPNKYFADFSEWKIMFEKVFTYLKKDFFLVWHSLWATFLIKYLSENNFVYNPKNIFLLAAAFKDSLNEKIWTFNFLWDFENFQKNYVKNTYFLHSKDDFVVPFSDFLEFKKIFSKANFIEFEDKNHFLDKEFKEFIDLIKKSN